jgi:hypothetical protein
MFILKQFISSEFSRPVTCRIIYYHRIAILSQVTVYPWNLAVTSRSGSAVTYFYIRTSRHVLLNNVGVAKREFNGAHCDGKCFNCNLMNV